VGGFYKSRKYGKPRDNYEDLIIDVTRAAKKRNNGDVRCKKCGCFLSIYNDTDKCFRHHVKKDSLDRIEWFHSMCSSRSVCLIEELSCKISARKYGV